MKMIYYILKDITYKMEEVIVEIPEDNKSPDDKIGENEPTEELSEDEWEWESEESSTPLIEISEEPVRVACIPIYDQQTSSSAHVTQNQMSCAPIFEAEATMYDRHQERLCEAVMYDRYSNHSSNKSDTHSGLSLIHI